MYKKDNRSKVWHGILKATLKKNGSRVSLDWKLLILKPQTLSTKTRCCLLEQKSYIFSHLTATLKFFSFLFTLASFLFTLASFPFLESTVLAFVIPLYVMPSPQITSMAFSFSIVRNLSYYCQERKTDPQSLQCVMYNVQ